MKMIRTSFWSVLLVAASMLIFISCGSDDDGGSSGPDGVTLTSLMASGTSLSTGADTTVDLNGATSATDVPPNSEITAEFSKELNASSVTTSSVTISAGGEAVDIVVTTSGSTVTITASSELPRGTDLTITFAGSITAADGGALAETTRSFRTDGRAVVTPPLAGNLHAYWKFDGDASDAMGTYDDGTEVAIEYQADRFGAQSSCAYFDGDASIIEIADADVMMDDATDFTVSFWVKTNSDGHVNENGDPTGHFVFGLGAFYGIQYEIFSSYHGSKFAISYENDTTNFSEDMWFPANATDNTNGGWQGWDFAKSIDETTMEGILKDTWVHVVYAYNATERKGSMYFNGELMKSFDFDLWPDGDPKRGTIGVDFRGAEPDVVNELAFGFVQSRAGTLWDSEPWGGYDITTSQHFKGWLDDFRIFHGAYSDTDVETLYNAEKP